VACDAFNRNRNSSEIYNQKGNYKIANKFMYEWERKRVGVGGHTATKAITWADKTDFDIRRQGRREGGKGSLDAMRILEKERG